MKKRNEFDKIITRTIIFTRFIFTSSPHKMLDFDIKHLDSNGKNGVISKLINLDERFDLIVLISSKDKWLWELILNKILDTIIDNIDQKNLYKDFSHALENINGFLDTWRTGWDKIKWLNMVVGILSRNNLIFSTVGSPSCYFINSDREVVEITEREETRKEFGFISSGDMKYGEVIAFSNIRLLDYLSFDDFKDGMLHNDMKSFNKNILNILKEEAIKKNVSIISLKNNDEGVEKKENEMMSSLMDWWLKFFDNHFTKRMLALYMLIKENLTNKSKNIRNGVFLLGILIAFFLLYGIVSWVIRATSNTNNIEASKEDLIKAKEYIRLASENINNPDIFTLNVKQAEDIVYEIQEKKLFLNDVGKIFDDIWVIKKQFNGIETFEKSPENLVYGDLDSEDTVKILKTINKLYILGKRSVIGPITAWDNPQEYIFENLAVDDEFIDGTAENDNLVLMTKSWKVVNFAKNNFFSYLDVSGQDRWDKSPIVDSFLNNIYLLNQEQNQIIRHKKSGNAYAEGSDYLKAEDADTIGGILDVAIDGGIYILKKDLSVVKLFRSPTYRLESLILNNLPKNYDIEEWKQSLTQIKARNNLNYVYIFLNNKILIFKPNTNRYQDTKSLDFIGQIEGRDFVIKDFYVDNDGDLMILGDDGVYRMKFEVSDGRLIVRS